MQAQAQDQAQQAQYDQIQQAIAQKQEAEMAAYNQAVAEYQAAQAAQVEQVRQQVTQQVVQTQIEQARQQIMQQMVQAQIEAQITAYISQVQMDTAQQALLKQAVEEQLANQIAAQIQQGAQVQIQDQMVADAIVQSARQIHTHQNAGMPAMGAEDTITQQRDQQRELSYARAAQIRKAAAVQTGEVRVSGAKRPFIAPVVAQDIVDIAQVWKKLERNSKAWALLIDDRDKVMTVYEFIERFRKKGVKINKQPTHYAQMVDEMSIQNPQMLLNSFMDVLQLMAVMEYDFDAGVDKDLLARKMLGSDSYEANKKRLGK